jgi:23S rRNA pseudouridine955/2504/2580 synthase
MKATTGPARPAVSELQIGAGQAGQRIDNFLLRQLKGVPKSHIYRILRTGQVRVNRGRVRPEYRLQEGDAVRIPPLRLPEPGETARPPDGLMARLAAAILFEDARLLVLDKPAGLAVHGGTGLRFGVIEVLRALRPNAECLELVHRLDRETSGCLMIAKDRHVLRDLHDLLRNGGIEKRYLALAAGRWPHGARDVDLPVGRQGPVSGERRMGVDADGRDAVTHFRPVTLYRDVSLLEVTLGTGRTHQIRVHAAHLGHPLAGDDKYGDAGCNKRCAELGLKRMFLHAQALEIPPVGGGGSIDVQAPLPADLAAVLDRLA